jgi:hypothetical protein
MGRPLVWRSALCAALTCAAGLPGSGCSDKSQGSGKDAGGADGGVAGTCYPSCDPTADAGPGACSSGNACATLLQVDSSGAPTTVSVCLPEGRYTDSCPASCANGSICTTGTVTPIAASVPDGGTQFDVREHMLAAVEMQLAGEPLAEAMGRQLSGYSRDTIPPNTYFDPSPTATGPYVDLVGFGTAVESYEYSKQPMNNLNFESGAGISLVYGPLVNPNGATGTDAINLLAAKEQHFADLAGLSGPVPIISWNKTLVNGMPTGPAPPLGWPGFWPTMHPYVSFDPAIDPTNAVDWFCSIASDDTPGSASGVLNEDYECDYTTLHLPDRARQITFDITPGSSGWAGWKSALWVMNYLQIMHDVQEDSIASVPPAQLSQVGQANNTVTGTPNMSGGLAVAGTYVGSSNIEGFQAANMIYELDNQAEHWLTALTTSDGMTLSGFPAASCTSSTASTCDPVVLSALQYDFNAPLRWIPAQIAVMEDNPDATYGGPFPQPTGYQILSSNSSLLDLDGLLGAYSSMYALTDRQNTGVGGAQTAEVYFSGDPFPLDDGMPDGEQTLHDRSLAMMRFVTVTLDRLHRDPASGLLVDTVTFQGNVPTRGATVATSSTAYTIVALRNVRRSLASLLALYSNTTPDEAVSSTPLDVPTFSGAPGGMSFTQRLTTLINTQSQLLMDHLTTADGHAYSGWNVQTGALVDTMDTLDSHTAAIRGLLAAYLSTGNAAYRTRALAVFNRMNSVFYDPAMRMYAATPAPNATITYTPLRFAMLEAAFRDLYELYGNQPGQAALGQLLQSRLMRLIKLVLNGWDDRNENQSIDYPQECVNVVNGLPRGGLQMAERALSGDLGSLDDDILHYMGPNPVQRIITTDRERDCVPDIAAAKLPSALANEVDFTPVKP